jgi:hypothetical protein
MRQAVAQRRRLPRLPLERTNHVWSFEFVESRTHDGRSLSIMTLIDEYTRECQALPVARRITSLNFIETLADAMLQTGGQSIFDATTAPKCLPRRFVSGLLSSGPSLFISSLAARGRTGDVPTACLRQAACRQARAASVRARL